MPSNPLEWRHEQAGRCERFAELDALLSRGNGVWAKSRTTYRARRRAYMEGKRDHHKKRPMTITDEARTGSSERQEIGQAQMARTQAASAA